MTAGSETATLNDVYLDRNLLAQLVAVLAQQLGMRVGLGFDPNEPEWPLIYIDLPTGQVSWHIPQRELVAVLDPYEGEWDGHSVEEKRQRIQAFLESAGDGG